ncbi:MAG: MerR family transcriptional regulator [Actinobacteria bacterium]|nr:MerR family transcriptional regulator [Actinomycetota bacterium]
MADDTLFDRPVYVISVAAELASMHPQTLRMYERRGLVAPRRLPNNRRMYSQQDLERLRRIQELTEIGLNLAGVERVLELEHLVASLQADMERLRAEMEEAARRFRKEVQRVEQSHRHDLVPVGSAAVIALRRRTGGGER